jgi:hypothetical protein
MNFSINNLPKLKSVNLKVSRPITIVCTQYSKTTSSQGKKEPLSNEQIARTTITHKRSQRIEKVKLKLNKTKRMITIRTLGWNFALYAQWMIEEQEAMTFYNVIGPLSMLET